MIENERKMQALLGVLPVLMDYMEDIKEQYPKVYSKGIKKAGNDFIEQTDRHLTKLFGMVKHLDGHMTFYDQVQNVSTAFMQWVETDVKEEDK